jgi:hypothetical protein
MVKRLAMLLATVDAAIVYQKGRKDEGFRLLPSLTYPDAVLEKRLKVCKGQ